MRKLRYGGAVFLAGTLAVAILGSGLLRTNTLHAQAQVKDDPPKLDTSAPLPPPPIAGLKMLFSGKQEEIGQNWEQKGKPGEWDFEDGAMVSSKTGNISTKEKFSDFQLHVEFREPYKPDAKGQARGNSGVFLQGRYEVQVLDSYGIKDPGNGDCGAIYTIAAPLVNACKPPLQWQTYDIVFRAPRYDTGTHTLIDPARATVFQNGILIQNQVSIPRLTHQTAPKKPAPGEAAKPVAPAPPTEDLSTPGPITLQYHSNRVAFRNIWIVPLALQGAQHY